MKSGYDPETRTFTLTASRMEHYHRNHPHISFSREACPVCQAQYGREYMAAVAAFLTANGFEVVDIGALYVTIAAPSKARKKFGTLITKETDTLYQLLSGQTEPDPASLEQNAENMLANDSLPIAGTLSVRDADPLSHLHDWLDDMKVQIRTAAHPTAEIEIAVIERIQAKILDMQNVSGGTL